MATVALNGHPTWFTRGRGRGTKVVLLHGGLSSSASPLRSIGPRLAEEFRVAAFDRRGHGRTADTVEPFHYEEMATETIAFLEFLGGRSHLVGHSDGGIVALLTALRRPDLVRRAVAVGANFHHDAVATSGSLTFEGPDFEEWAEKFGAQSPDGAAHARVVADKSLTLFATEPNMSATDFAMMSRPVLVMSGDDDVVPLAHSIALYESMPDAQLAVVPGSSHAVLKERPAESARIIRRFLTQRLPPMTLQPVRRTTSGS
ncbi:MAG TPA: alpha/beta hydrolase [Acidimicrobiales bacterium]|nr:alpha/beta hydrolase [Acidimicrobiales bacterium]